MSIAITGFFGFNRPEVVFTPTDADAVSFINDAGLTNVIEKIAIQNLVISLKNENLWTKMVAIYPFVGSSAFSHRLSLRNVARIGRAPLTFSPGFSHTYEGCFDNGGTASSPFNPHLDLPYRDLCYSFYTTTETPGNDLSAELISTIQPSQIDHYWNYIRRRKNTTDWSFIYFAGRPFNMVPFTIARATPTWPGYHLISYFESAYKAATINKIHIESGQMTFPDNTNNISYLFGNPQSPFGTGGAGIDCKFAHFGRNLFQNERNTLTDIVNQFQDDLGRPKY